MVIVSDDAGQFNVLIHALCWIHAERLINKLTGLTDEQKEAVKSIRSTSGTYMLPSKISNRSRMSGKKPILRPNSIKFSLKRPVIQNNMKPNQNHISIILEGFSCSPEEITEKIGLKPTWIALKNQEYQIGPPNNRITKKYETNCWQFRIDKEDQSWVSEQVREFLAKHIRPRKKQIKQVVSSCEGELSIVHYIFEGCNPGLHFGKEEIELLSEIGLELDIDIYCLADD